MKIVIRLLAVLHGAVALSFAAAGVLLIGAAAHHLWSAVGMGFGDTKASLSVIEAIGLLAIALVALEITQTVVEEEIIREANISAPTRVRRYISRFLAVVVVALSVEALVATFAAQHEDPSALAHAASIGFAAAALLAGWGVFIWLNRAAEDIEPDAMRKAKGEDSKVE
jgi:hypothetical protein